MYAVLKPMRKLSNSSSNLVDPSAPDNKPSQDSNGSMYIPLHKFYIEPLARRRQRTDTSTLSFYALFSDSAARLLKQHA